MASIAALLTSDTPVSPLNHEFCFASGIQSKQDIKPTPSTFILNAEQKKNCDAEVAKREIVHHSSVSVNYSGHLQCLSVDGMQSFSDMQSIGRRASTINRRLMEKEKGKLSVIFPRRKMGEASRKTDAVWLSMELVHSLSDRSLQEAAKHLGISATALKKACRVLGIERWPYCRKRIQDGDCSSSKDAQSPDSAPYKPCQVGLLPMARVCGAGWAYGGKGLAASGHSSWRLTETRGRGRALSAMRCSLTLPTEKSLVLLSGGVESVTLMPLLSARMGSKVSETHLVPLFVDYAQRGAEMERRASKRVCDRLGLELLELDASRVGQGMRLRQKQRLHVPVPHRNLFALSLALAMANVEGAKKMHIAIQKEDTDWYPSASRDFLAASKSMVQLLEPQIELLTPFLDMTKQQVLELGVEVGVDYSGTYSCIRGGERHCGTCKQCRERKKSFEEARIPEPPDFYEQ
ncbi:hypothetical protein GUITHDRAFT_105455 [Guillardia theta CCMP2712]|uniref:7-cyano-7-deazaguanine synthase n=1 Tax=Guillardia theta (strain CCMP2712) TaxID=905079 RepID=L1JK31_GUITC|nr:hypothetical protein GUITHDRAFT_105455 [Guillardia theta CCMP2712]EKX48831.1 hypothetical protein GUITHDRAFT_105455 [Guillardia theta CCMP2712]|eukprot:XP_005835811.1 hypothetical protein GUITHDRAFT_105455 [Guillardia theta CCMP2712]